MTWQGKQPKHETSFRDCVDRSLACMGHEGGMSREDVHALPSMCKIKRKRLREEVNRRQRVGACW